jgi:hypothetical protein
MKTNKIISAAIVLFVFSANITFSQVGRHELQLDTTLIGGKEQEDKMNRMEGRDDLMKQLVSLRDSIDTHLTSLNNNGANVNDVNKQRNDTGVQALTKYKAELNEVIDKLKGKDKLDTEVTRRAYAKLNEVRDGFGKIKDSNKPEEHKNR